jgi:nitrate reductase molybdenum cofactor assembly chaperone NarJ/NarW
MKMTLRALAVLLGYPSEELQAHIAEIRDALRAEAALPSGALRKLEPLLRALATEELLELQAAYSELFDRSRSLSLHLFEHVHGDNRERGQAMVDLAQQYKDRGLAFVGDELPDFVPAFLEYASCVAPEEARQMLGQPAHVFAALAERLDKKGTSYAAVFHAVLALARAAADADAVAALSTPSVDEGLEQLDQHWEEQPVSFSAAPAPAGRVAKVHVVRHARTGTLGS